MPSISLSKTFRRRCEKSQPDLVAQAQAALSKFVSNPHQHSLNFEKVKGRADYHTIRVNGGDRLVLRKTGKDSYDVIDFGSHTYIYNSYG